MRHVRAVPIAAAAVQLQRPQVTGAPPAYDHRKQLLAGSVATVEAHWPELAPLARDGTLVVVPRPEGYMERREDGYQEPECIFLVGTAHLSPQSAADVTRVVLAVRPENVVVELCKSRAGAMYEESEPDAAGSSGSTQPPAPRGSGNAMGMAGPSLLEAFQRSLSLGGRSALLLRLLLGELSSQLSAEVGVRSGAEFRAARAAGEEIGAQIVLGDRPVEVTLRRAWDALTWRERASLAAELAAGAQGARGAGAEAAALAVEKLKDDDAVSAMLAALAERYPAAVAPLVHERDLYLAWSLKRSKAVNGTKRVVGVVGRGHLRGVCYALTHDSGQLRFKDLAGGRGGSSKAGGWGGAAGRLAVETAAVSGLWYAWTVLHPQ